MVLVTFDQRNEVTIKDLNDLEQVEQAVTSFLSDFSHSEASKPVVNTRQSTLTKGYDIVEITGVGKRWDGKGFSWEDHLCKRKQKRRHWTSIHRFEL